MRAVTLLLLLLLAPAAQAAGCTVSASPVIFGAYNAPVAILLDTAGAVSVTCTPDLVASSCSIGYTIGLGTGASGSYAQRTMSNGVSILNYNLFSDSGRSIIWGDGSGAAAVSDTITTSAVAALCLPGNKVTPVYGRMPASQNVTTGIYGDTITVTVSF